KYVQAYNLLDGMRIYDEAKMQKALDVDAVSLYVTYKYLGKLIAKSLVLKKYEVHDHLALDAAGKMLSFGLWEIAKVIIVDGIKGAEAREEFEQLYQLLELADHLPKQKQWSRYSREELAEIQGELAALRTCEQALRRILQTPTEGEVRKRVLDRCTAVLVLTRLEDLASVRARVCWLKVRTGILMLEEKFRHALEMQRKLVELVLAHPELYDDHQLRMIKEMGQLANFESLNGEWRAAETTLFKVGNIDATSHLQEVAKFNVMYPVRLLATFYNGNLEAGKVACADMLAYVDDNKKALKKKKVSTNLYFAALLHFSFGDYEGSNRLLHRFFQFSKSDTNPVYRKMAPYLQAIIFFEQGDFENAFKRISKLSKNGNAALGTLPAFLYSFVRSLCNAHQNEQQKMFAEAYEEVLILAKQAENQNFLYGFDVRTWFESKQYGIPMAEVYANRHILEGRLRYA
ncbi:MAG: hypothetical protein AAF570_19835, partial [Bacteroidota bacterium]